MFHRLSYCYYYSASIHFSKPLTATMVEKVAEEFGSHFLRAPMNLVLCGATGSGKTQLASDLIKSWDKVVDDAPKIKRFVLCYRHYQPIYDEMVRSLPKNCEVRWHKGFPASQLETADYWAINDKKGEDDDDDKFHNLLLLDDVASLAQNAGLALETLTTIYCHHLRVNIIFVCHELYKMNPILRTVLRNSHYLFILRSPFMGSVMTNLQKNLYPGLGGILNSAYQECFDRLGCRYLLIDNSPFCPSQFRLRSGILPEEKIGYAFLPTDDD